MHIFFIFICSLLLGCTIEPRNEITLENDTVVANEVPTKKLNETYDVYTNKNLKYETLESDTKYIGAYILSDNSINGNIKSFEEKMKFSHSHYLYTYKLGNSFNDEWLYECISNNKTPYIIIKPEDGNYYNLENIENFYNNISRYNSFFFIELYPLEVSKNYDMEKYKTFFNEASKILKENEKIAIVFNNFDLSPIDASMFTPDENSYDWVGLSYFGTIKDGTYPDFYSNLNFIYDSYSSTKPIFISNFAISHYSKTTGTYLNGIDEINNIYDNLNEKYPRVKGINYININGIRTSKNFSQDNFLLTDTKEIYDEYGKTLENNNFKSNITDEKDKIKSLDINLYLKAYNYDGILYFDNTIIKKFELPEKLIQGEKIQDKDLIKISELEKYLNISINEQNKKIIIKSKK